MNLKKVISAALLLILLSITTAYIPYLFSAPRPVQIAWDYPNASANGITKYTVKWDFVTRSISGMYANKLDVTGNVGSVPTTATLQLEPGTYFIAVSAWNPRGESPNSEEITHTVLLPLPTAPSGVRVINPNN